MEENNQKPDNRDGIIITRDIEREMKKSFLDYSMSVIVSRALPDVRDGLKPVHRRILYSMSERDLTHDKAFRKAADTVGAVLGSYHPHGDASVYDAMVRLAQDFSMRYPLVEGQGNFGSIDGDPPAAYRYTEARLQHLTDYMLEDIEKDTVDFMPNYDDRTMEPTVLPSRFPNLLVNGSTGIAVGMATNIPPHNLKEIVEGLIYLIDNPDCDVLDLLDYVHGPDFPTGGVIMGLSGIRAAYATGRGRITLRGKVDIEENNGRYTIVISEVPYMVNKARLFESIADLIKDKRVEGVADLGDESDREGIRIVVELKRDANPQLIINQLYRYTQLQDTVGVIMLALKDGIPQIMDLKTVMQSYIDFQCDVVTRRTNFNLKRARDRAHILEGLRRAVDIIDEIITTIRGCKGGSSEAKQTIMEKFEFDDAQATAIIQLQLGRLAGLEIQRIENELKELEERIKELQGLLDNRTLLNENIKEELVEISTRFSDARRTEIVPISGEMDIEDLIPVEDCVITLTHFGYIKRQPSDIYKSQKRGGRGITGLTRRDEDFVSELFVCSTHDHLLFMSNKGRVYTLKGYEVPEGSRTSRGTNIVNLLPISAGEKVTTVIRVSDFTDAEYIVMVTRKGFIKKSKLSLYSKINKSGVFGITLSEDDDLAWVRLTDGTQDLIVATANGMAIRFSEKDARPMGRVARGVKAISLSEGDSVVGMSTVRDGSMLLTVTEDGKGRLTDVAGYRIQRRGGKGLVNYRKGMNAVVAGVKAVDADDDVILISQTGIIIRFHVEDINATGRYGQGVRVMRLAADDKVVTVARAERDTEEDNSPDEITEGAADEIPEIDDSEE